MVKAVVFAVLFALTSGLAFAESPDFQARLDHAGVAYQVPPVGKAILVNIPAFELIAFHNGAPVFRSRVIVGTPHNRTPRLETHVSTVRFRPTWRPTPSMVASGEYEDWVRPPGEDNPLGLAAVRLSPGLLVYLHDTNKRHLFSEPYRALSHGCVRVDQWEELVGFVLSISFAQVKHLAHGRRTFDAPAAPIPVTLGYFTRFPDPTGQIVRHADVYGLEASAEVAGDGSDATAHAQ